MLEEKAFKLEKAQEYFFVILQVYLLLYIAQAMIYIMWQRRTDPDSSAIPYLTAIGDLLGTGLLALSFHLLFLLGDGDTDLGD